ncbi:ankyrin repeat domain-containing protein SOWAHB [Mobula hypostoma]|uniref:ankyrin repeat domain-containing protein SOWAHB n=1 Tax=Mobula hypostoma TaxID=723540 RepID=UPI002FC35D14
MFEKIEASRGRFLPATKGVPLAQTPEGDRLVAADHDWDTLPTKGSDRHCPTYDRVLEDVNRLSSLLGRFLQATDELVGANAARTQPLTGSLAARRISRRSLRLERCDSGVSAGARAQSRKVAADQRLDGEDPMDEGLAEHEWMMAAAGGDLEKLTALLDSVPSLLNRKDPVTGLTAAHWLAKQGNDGALRELVRLAEDRGLRLDLNCRAGGGGHTPLHLAAMQGHQMVIKLLIGAYNVDVDARDFGGRKACHYLASGVPGKFRELVGAENRERPHGTADHSKKCARSQEAEETQVDGQLKKPQFPVIASLQRILQANYRRWWKRTSF